MCAASRHCSAFSLKVLRAETLQIKLLHPTHTGLQAGAWRDSLPETKHCRGQTKVRKGQSRELSSTLRSHWRGCSAETLILWLRRLTMLILLRSITSRSGWAEPRKVQDVLRRVERCCGKITQRVPTSGDVHVHRITRHLCVFLSHTTALALLTLR